MNKIWTGVLLLTACTSRAPSRVVGVGPAPEAWLRAAEGWLPRLEGWRGHRFDKPVRLQRVAGERRDEWGLYDAEQGVLSLSFPVSADPAEPLVAATLVHELVHALQDQHHGLAGFASQASDVDQARLALVEGEAMLAAEELVGLDLGAHRLASLQSAADPLGLYTEGASYVRFVRDAGGWEAVDAAWAAPPSSTAEILSPGAFAEGAEVVGVGALGGGETVGAFRLLEVLAGAGLAPDRARQLAAAWRGDALAPEVREGVSGWRWTLVLATAPATALLASAGPGALSSHLGLAGHRQVRADQVGDRRVVLWWAEDVGQGTTPPTRPFPLRR